MTIIGNFTQKHDGFEGSISTLTLKTKVSITPVEKASERAPDYRLYVGKSPIGAAWSATSQKGKPYLGVRLEDPAFAVGTFRLVETAKGFALIWNH
jgi:uncharacterized protein (DUF736 family)